MLININGPTVGWTPCKSSVQSTNLWLTEQHPRGCDDISWLHLLQLHDFVMLRIAVEQYKLLDPATDAFSVGATAHLTCCAHFRSDTKATIKKQKMESIFSSLSIQLLRKVVNKVKTRNVTLQTAFLGPKVHFPTNAVASITALTSSALCCLYEVPGMKENKQPFDQKETTWRWFQQHNLYGEKKHFSILYTSWFLHFIFWFRPATLLFLLRHSVFLLDDELFSSGLSAGACGVLLELCK